MKDLRALSDNLLALRKQYRAVLEMGEFLDEVANLGQVRDEILKSTDEARKVKTSAVAEAERVSAELALLKSERALLSSEFAAMAEDAAEKAKAVVEEAHASARHITAAATDKLKGLEQQIVQRRDELVKAAAAVEGKQSELASIEKQVADLRAVASSIATSLKL